MNFQSGNDRNFNELSHVGIAIRRVCDEQNHVGILYRVDENHTRFCHFAFHHDLRDERPNNRYYWNGCSFLDNDETNGRIFAATMLKIAKHKRLISYGIHYERNPFSSDGEFLGFPENGMGLTCASFIAAVFASLGLPIVLMQTWQERPEDAAWQDHIMRVLVESNKAPMQHVEAARSYIGALRLRPEEVAVAVASEDPPRSFQQVVQLASQLDRQISTT